MADARQNIEKALGFAPLVCSEVGGDHRLAIYVWRGHLHDCVIDSVPQTTLILHQAGAVTSIAIDGRVFRRPSAPGLLTLVPKNYGLSCWAEGEIQAVTIHLDPADHRCDRAATAEPAVLLPRAGFHDEFLAAALRALADAAAAPFEDYQLYTETLARAIALRLVRNQGMARRAPGQLISRQTMEAVTGIIEGSIETGISLNRLANAVGMSRARFFRLFKNTAGLSPHQYIVQRRITRAQRLLAGTSRPIADVALKCGFANQAHFTTSFGRLVGVTPLHYRRNLELGRAQDGGDHNLEAA